MKELAFYKKLLKILISHLKRENEFKAERSEVEDVFKLGKCGSLWTKYTDL